MKLRRLIQIEDRRATLYEKRMARKVFRALKSQVGHYIEYGYINNSMEATLKESYRPVIVDFFERQYKILSKDRIEKKERFFVESWDRWLEDYILRESVSAAAIIDGTTKEWIQGIEDNYRRNILSSGASGETVESISDYIQQVTGGAVGRRRARMIARTETGKAVNIAKKKSSDEWENESGMPQGKLWIHRGAKHPRDWHQALDTGVAIPKNQKFVVKGPSGNVDLMDRPHDLTASAENVVNCGCVIIYTRM